MSLLVNQGLYGAFVVKYNLQVASFRRKHLSGHGITEAVILSAATALVSYFNKFLRIDMTESMAILFKECEGGGDYDNLCQCVCCSPILLAVSATDHEHCLAEPGPSGETSTLCCSRRSCARASSSFRTAARSRPASLSRRWLSARPLAAWSASSQRRCTRAYPVRLAFSSRPLILIPNHRRANPESSWFGGVCSPDVPCITPGTYALLGAAAALWFVQRDLLFDRKDVC
jgi:chloride channel 3/4/5